ncbi:alpha,alpha-trehalase TreF [Tellurirhabdus bombi]|uniref:alpha,alpha-trehalase TreF n=1 Tax=Tellurirhabdus bombi TaxID=2907205 RepID=UPI001F1BD726|nr:alpha,alpha-trehalase TreF [Tellurirhabdus bombi]
MSAPLSLPLTPDQLFGPLYFDVQLSRIFGDSKTFVDCVPKMNPADIVTLYEIQKGKPDFDLLSFVHQHFILPTSPATDFTSNVSVSTVEHIEKLWDLLTRPADAPTEGSSRLPLPYPHVVPGGRFREIFYWDSYFTMLGLKQSGRLSLLRNMMDNFTYLIDTYGFIPNGNRTYFQSRSQPPYFAQMVDLMVELDGPDALTHYLPYMRQEYNFWMSGSTALSDTVSASERVVQVPGGLVLNRYWDPLTTPRPEAYPKEAEAAQQARHMGISPAEFSRHIRAACESGWDFSSRWLADGKSMATIYAADIVPVDLNCLMYYLENQLQKAYSQSNNPQEADRFRQLAASRKETIQRLFWSDTHQFFMDYDLVNQQLTPAITLAGVYPLFFKLATPEQAGSVHDRLRDEFLQPGGLITSLERSGQQWDSPNGWAPLQWTAYQALKNYGFDQTAQEVRRRWLHLNDQVFKATGKMTEKYNVVTTDAAGGGGNYPNQDGFGWTNGVYLQLLHS